jgi:hypothetical protein
MKFQTGFTNLENSLKPDSSEIVPIKLPSIELMIETKNQAYQKKSFCKQYLIVPAFDELRLIKRKKKKIVKYMPAEAAHENAQRHRQLSCHD